MLTRAEALIEYDDASGCVVPDRLRRRTHRLYLGYARRLLAIYASGIGETRRELHRQVDNTFAALDDCPRGRIAAFRKLLDDVSEFDGDSGKKSAKLRQQVFTMSAQFHPLVSRVEGLYCNLEMQVKQRIAAELKCSWEEIDSQLFADVIEFQRLKKFEGYPTAEDFLARYNVAQTQASLYRAEQLTVWSRQDHKQIIRYAKLARLMHSIRREADGSYCFRFDGPASILRGSTRYGVAMARFLPGLLACRQWHALAKVINRFGKRYRLELSSEDGLQSTAAAATEYDSELEECFEAAWRELENRAQDRCGWKLQRESEILHAGQLVFTPDFTLLSPAGRRVLLEIVGYWTPEYLEHKTKQLEKFVEHDILLAVPEQTHFKVPVGMQAPILFKRQLKPADVLARLEETSRF